MIIVLEQLVQSDAAGPERCGCVPHWPWCGAPAGVYRLGSGAPPLCPSESVSLNDQGLSIAIYPTRILARELYFFTIS